MVPNARQCLEAAPKHSVMDEQQLCTELYAAVHGIGGKVDCHSHMRDVADVRELDAV